MRHIEPAVALQIAHHACYLTLTSREVEVLQRVAAGNSNKLIAKALTISEQTAKTYVKSITEKSWCPQSHARGHHRLAPRDHRASRELRETATIGVVIEAGDSPYVLRLIPFWEPIRPEDLPRWVPGKILLASDTSRFSDVVLRRYEYGPSEVFIPPLRDYGLVLYKRGPTSMDRRVDGPWSRELLVPGNVSLLTRVEPSYWHWTADIEVTHLYLSQEVLARVSADVFDRDIADVRLKDVLKVDDEVLRAGITAMAEEVQTNNLGGQLFVDALATQVCIQILRHHALVTFREKPVVRRGSVGIAGENRIAIHR